jgi:hypothetical protein
MTTTATLAEVLSPDSPLGLSTAPMSLRSVLIALPDDMNLDRYFGLTLDDDVTVTRSTHMGRPLLILRGAQLVYEERL